MLLRFITDNFLSFGGLTEFNLFSGSPRRLSHHIKEKCGVKILTYSAIYGANGAGKTNLLKSIEWLKRLVLKGEIPSIIETKKFKLNKKKESPIKFGIEFITHDIPFLYGLTIDKAEVIEESFYISGLSSGKDELLFSRTRDDQGKTKVEFGNKWLNSPEREQLKRVIEKNLLKPYQLLITLLVELEGEEFPEASLAYSWLEEDLVIITQFSDPGPLTKKIDDDIEFRDFVNQLISTLSTGIQRVKIRKTKFEDFFKNASITELEQLKDTLSESEVHQLEMRKRSNDPDLLMIENDNGEFYIKQLLFEHLSKDDQITDFNYNEISDGSQRLLDYLPAVKEIIEKDKVFIIDEIERSIHPLLIKELLLKLSTNLNVKGQLIFTTHESNLLNLDLFRQDEIWFTQKGPSGVTRMYPLSDFRTHPSIDIRKGYLEGRFGGIPFLSNLNDLKWKEHGVFE